MKNCKLIIIGGMGADAGIRLAQYAIQEARNNGAEKDSDFPDFILYNLPIKGMDKTGIINEKQVLQQIKESIMFFKSVSDNKTSIVIACNSVHALFPLIKNEYRGILLNMVEIACEAVKGKYKRVGILCSESTRASGIYSSALEKISVRYLYPSPTDQIIINATIQTVINGGSNNYPFIVNIIQRLKKDGAEAVILGCTELPIVFDRYLIPVPVIDAGLETIKKALKNAR